VLLLSLGQGRIVLNVPEFAGIPAVSIFRAPNRQ